MTEARRARPLLGTLVDIHARADFDAARLNVAIDAAFAAVADVHRLMSVHDRDSEASVLNRDAHRQAVVLSPHTLAVLRAALAMSEDSDGAFDLVIGARLQSLGLLPSTTDDEADSAACWRDIEFVAENAVMFRRPMRLDFGGIAKGYAVDCAINVLRGAGVAAAMVNAGGDLRVMGSEPQAIQIRDARDPAVSAHHLSLIERALATSGTYYSLTQQADGIVSALIDPHSGRPYIGNNSVSVVAPSCMLADALTKVVLFGAPEQVEALLEKHDAQAFVQRTGNDLGAP